MLWLLVGSRAGTGILCSCLKSGGTHPCSGEFTIENRRQAEPVGKVVEQRKARQSMQWRNIPNEAAFVCP